MLFTRTSLAASLAAALGLATLALAGCGLASGGRTVTEDRAIPAEVTAVELAGTGTVNLTAGTDPSLRVTAGENVIDRVVTEVDGSVLRLDLRGTFTGYTGPLVYDVSLPTVTALTLVGSGTINAAVDPGESLVLTLDGSGEVTVREIETARLTVVLSGSGTITTSGSALTADLRLDGSGAVRAANLEAGEATAEVAGSGRIDVTATGTLLAIVSGSGTITFAGDARVTEEISGSGDVRER